MSVPIILHEVFLQNAEGEAHLFNWGKIVRAYSNTAFEGSNSVVVVDEADRGLKTHSVRETLEEIDALVTDKMREIHSSLKP
jgi:hypothetical protein